MQLSLRQQQQPLCSGCMGPKRCGRGWCQAKCKMNPSIKKECVPGRIPSVRASCSVCPVYIYAPRLQESLDPHQVEGVHGLLILAEIIVFVPISVCRIRPRLLGYYYAPSALGLVSKYLVFIYPPTLLNSIQTNAFTDRYRRSA